MKTDPITTLAAVFHHAQKNGVKVNGKTIAAINIKKANQRVEIGFDDGDIMFATAYFPDFNTE